MAHFLYPQTEAAATDHVNLPVNIELVRSMRRLRLIGSEEPAIQFFFAGPGTSTEWAFLTDADRDAAWTHIMTEYGSQIG